MVLMKHQVDNRMMVLFGVLFAEILASIISQSDAIRAVGVSVVLCATIVMVFLSWCMSPSLKLKSYAGKPLLIATIMIGLGMYGLLIAVARRNGPYYIAADIYHWFFELLLMAAITMWAVARSESIGIAIALALQGIILGGMGIFTFVAGTAGLPLHAGHIVENLHIWRLELSRGFPELPLLFITAALLIKKRERWPKSVRILLWISFAIYFPCLIVTLKRSMWLSYLGGVVLMLIPRRKLILGAVVGLLSLPVIASFVIVFRNAIMSMLLGMADMLAYNPAYTVEDTLGERVKQILSVLPYIIKNIYGYGMGAQFYGYWPGENTFGVIHYIHNLYVYYILQIGLPGFLLMLLAGVWFLWMLMSCMDRNPDWNWMLRATFSCVAVIAVNGMVLVSIHTAFAGLVVGLGMLAYLRVSVPVRRLAAAPIPINSLTLGKGGALVDSQPQI